MIALLKISFGISRRGKNDPLELYFPPIEQEGGAPPTRCRVGRQMPVQARSLAGRIAYNNNTRRFSSPCGYCNIYPYVIGGLAAHCVCLFLLFLSYVQYFTFCSFRSSFPSDRRYQFSSGFCTYFHQDWLWSENLLFLT